MPDILLIQPPIRDFYLTAKRTIPYGLACVAASLRRAGFTAEILDGLATGKSRVLQLPDEMSCLKDLYLGPDLSPFSIFQQFRHYGRGFERLGEAARKSGARIVGISSLFTAYSDEALKTAEAVKRWCPEAVVILGGHHPTEMPEEVLSNRCVDYIVRGEGEEAMPRLVRALIEGSSLESVPGVGFRTAHGKIFANPPAIVADLDSVPAPAIELTDLKFYRRKKAACAVIVSGRGCPLSCSYCSVGGSSWNRFRLKSIASVTAEMERAVLGWGVRFIDFEDENISFGKEWFRTLLGEIRSRFGGLGLELRAMNGLFAPTLDESVIRAMKEAGFSALNLSLCTTCRSQLARFGRPDVRESFENALRIAGGCGLETVGYVIAGAPGQRAEDSVEDLLYLARQKVLAGVSVFYPAPGSADFEACRKAGILPQKLSLMRATALPISDTTSRKDSATLLRLGRILNFAKGLCEEERTEVLRMAGFGEAAGIAQGPVAPECLESVPARDAGHRRDVGKVLLGRFLRDGIIRGASPDGGIFEHVASPGLCIKFRDGLLKLLEKRELR